MQNVNEFAAEHDVYMREPVGGCALSHVNTHIMAERVPTTG